MKIDYKSCGAVLLVSGTCIGAGMLALPIVTAHCGFWWSMVIFVGCWLVMLLSSLLVLEVNSALPEDASFSSMADATLGPWGKSVTWVVFLLLLYALLAAYDTAGSSLLSAIFTQFNLNVSTAICALIFNLVFGVIVFAGTQVTDYANRFLLLVKLCCFFLAVFLMAPQVNWLHYQSHWAQYRFVFTPIPVVLTAFGSHFIIPSIRRYIGPDPVLLRRILFVGMLIPLIIYLVWEFVAVGVVPLTGPDSFRAIAGSSDAIKSLVLVLVSLFHSHWVALTINGFMDVAVTTSFLGIALSLFDFFIDGFSFSRHHQGQRCVAAFCTFLVPLLFAVFVPGGFVMALRYAAVFAAVLVLILPALMSYQVTQGAYQPFYRQACGSFVRGLVFLAGVGIIVLFLLISFRFLPV